MTLRRGLLACLAALAAVLAPAAAAHEVRPAFFQIVEREDGKVDVLFKQPSTTALVVRLEPEISGDVLDAAPTTIDGGAGFQTRAWTGLDVGDAGLSGRDVTVHGLDRTITDALLVVDFADGHTIQHVLKPEQPTLSLATRGDALAAPTYFVLGIDHILTGYDHLLFVFGLVLLVRGAWTLVKAITAFTLAHSVTLAVTALGVLQVDPGKIEILVALSIVFVAVELANLYRGQPSITQKWPWLIAMAFGLLHGSAFAGALAEIGLPRDNIPAALLLFNLGVEAGQLIFVACVVVVGLVIKRFAPVLLATGRQIPAYAIGICACFWSLERFHTAVF